MSSDLNNVYTAQGSAASEAQAQAKGSTSTANRFDFFNGLTEENKKTENKFSTIFANLRTRLGESGARNLKNAQASAKAVSEMQAQSKQRAQDARDKRNELADEKEEERKIQERKQARELAHQEALDSAEQQLQDFVEMSQRQELADAMAQENKSANASASSSENDSDTSDKMVRPSDILASAFAGRMSSGSGDASGSAVSGAGGAGTAWATVGAAVSGATVFSGAGSSFASSSISGTGLSGANTTTAGSNLGSGSGSGSGSSLSQVTGYGLEEKSVGAQAAQAMMNVDGVESDGLGEQYTNLSNASEADKISSYNNQDLKAHLDVLARESNVSKLSLQMANPQTLAAQRRDAEALANLPTSKNDLGILTAPYSQQNQLLGSLNSSAQGTAQSLAGTTGEGGATAAVTAEFAPGSAAAQLEASAHALGQNMQEASAAVNQTGTRAPLLGEASANNNGASGRVNAIGTPEQAQGTAVTSAASSSLASSTSSASSTGSAALGTVGSTATQAVAASTVALTGHNAEAAQAQSQSEHALNHGILDAESARGNSKAQEALLRLAHGDTNGTVAGSNAAKLLAQVAGQQATQNASLMATSLLMPGSRGGAADAAAANAAANAAGLTASLSGMSGARTGSASATGVLGANAGAANAAVGAANAASAATATLAASAAGFGRGTEPTYATYQDSELYAQMFNSAEAEENAVAPSARNLRQGTHADNELKQGSGNGVAHAASALGAATSHGAQAGAQTMATTADNNALPPSLTNFNFVGDPTSDANEIHEHVMRMAARNLKQLAVELEPQNLGKMKINIALNDNNDALSVTLQAADPKTRALLEQALPQLQDILAKQNIVTEAHVYDVNESAPGTNSHSTTSSATANAAPANTSSNAALAQANGANNAATVTNSAASAAPKTSTSSAVPHYVDVVALAERQRQAVKIAPEFPGDELDFADLVGAEAAQEIYGSPDLGQADADFDPLAAILADDSDPFAPLDADEATSILAQASAGFHHDEA